MNYLNNYHLLINKQKNVAIALSRRIIHLDVRHEIFLSTIITAHLLECRPSE